MKKCHQKKLSPLAMIEIAECMKNDGFCYKKSKLEIHKESDFKIFISPQMNRNNRIGIATQTLLQCSIFDKEGKECFWSKRLAVSNKKQDSFCWFDFYGIESYEQSIQEIKEIISQHFYLLYDEWRII